MEILSNKVDASGLANTQTPKQIYRTLWRWHFYAGIFAMPFVIILSLTGALYLFKPQLDAFHDAPYRNLTITDKLATPEQQLGVAIAAVPNASFSAYELQRAPADAVNILLDRGNSKLRVYVHPQTLQVLAIENENERFLRVVHDIHGELLLGKVGSILVELAASWAIVLMLTGIYLWWPRNAKGLAGVLYPRLSLKDRLFWRDLHSVTGIWTSFFVLFLLLSGLPWALVWGSAFKEVRELTGTAAATQDWVIAGQPTSRDLSSADHADHDGHLATKVTDTTLLAKQISLNAVVVNAQKLHFAYPVVIQPPSLKSPNWSVKSNAQNRPLRAEAYFSPQTGELIHQQGFSQRHVIDRVVGIGVAAHEGQLFGWFNQLLGLITALSLVVISISGFFMWRKRAPRGVLGAPPAMPEAKIGAGFIVIILIAAVLLPVLGCSLIVIAILEKFVIKRWSLAQRWLGLT